MSLLRPTPEPFRDAVADSPRPTPDAASRRLTGIDGLRAAAALWVVLFHIRAFSGARLTGIPGLDLFIRSGSTGVSLFLVLSGFCLYVPYAGGRSHRFAARTFLLRRCRRLMPAYYASLVVVVAAYAIAGGHIGLPRFGSTTMAEQVAAHVSLTHQLFASTFYGFNGAYWSLGLEWEFYLTLPLLVVAARRIGLGWTVLAVVAVNTAYRLGLWAAIAHGLIDGRSSLAANVLPNLFVGRWGEFAFGMVAAEVYTRGNMARWHRWARIGTLPLAGAGIAASGNPLSHLLFGLAFFCLVTIVLTGEGIVARIFTWPPLVLIGVMSYSLYLVHQPLVQVMAWLLGADSGVAPRRVFIELLLLLPVILGAAWLLFVTVERRSLSRASLAGLPGLRLLFPGRDDEPGAPPPLTPPKGPSLGGRPARRVGQNVTALGGGQAITWAMTLLWTIVVPRQLGPAGMGLLVVAWSATSVFGLLMGLGTRPFIVRQMVARPSEGPALLGTALVLRICLAPVFLGAMYLYIRAAHYGAHAALVLELAAGATFLTLLAEPFLAAFQAVEHMKYLAYADVFSKSVQGPVGVVLALAGFGATGLTACWLVVAGVALVLQSIWLRPLVAVNLRTSGRQVRALVTESLPYYAFGLAFTVYLWIDSVLLGLLAPARVVGWYGVATKLFTTLMFVAVIISTAWLPRLIRAFDEGRSGLLSVARAPTELTLVLALPIVAGTAGLARPLIHLLYGTAYGPAAPVLVVLAFSLPLTYLNIMLNQVFVAANRPMVWTWLLVGATIVNPGLNLVLIRLWQLRTGNGAMGAAVSLLATEGLMALVGLLIVGRGLMGLSTCLRLARTAGAAGAMWGVIYATGPLGILAQVAAGGTVFVVCALALRVATAEEVAVIRAAAVRIGQRAAGMHRRTGLSRRGLSRRGLSRRGLSRRGLGRRGLGRRGLGT